VSPATLNLYQNDQRLKLDVGQVAALCMGAETRHARGIGPGSGRIELVPVNSRIEVEEIRS